MAIGGAGDFGKSVQKKRPMADYEDKDIARYRANHPEAQLFLAAGMGLFVHWGIHSVAGLQPFWSMIGSYPHTGTDAYPRERYYALACRFATERYEPERRLLAAKTGRFDYAVLTTKHIDGYSLWPSDRAMLGTHTHLGGRDLVEPFVRACRNCGLEVGPYYCFSDWAWPGFPLKDADFDYVRRGQHPTMSEEEEQAEFDDFYNYTLDESRELLTRYGRIDLLWFDGVGWRQRTQEQLRSLETIQWVRFFQPHIVINNRWGGAGDYATPECRMFESRPDQWWEMCMVTNGHRGYKPGRPLPDVDWWLDYRNRCNAWGGNFLPNVGPAPDGTMPEAFFELCGQSSRCAERGA